MNKAIVRSGQSMWDIAIQYCGSTNAVFNLAILNNLEITSSLSAGQVLLLPDPLDKKVVQYFAEGKYFPASQDNDDVIGIDYDIIESDLIIS